MTDVGARMRRARQAAGLSLSGMAARTNFSRSYLGNVETGRRSPTPDVVLAYEQALRDAFDRRGMLTALTATTLAPLAATELIERGFAAALGRKRTVAYWEATTAAYGRQYMELGAAEPQPRLAGDLVALQQHLERPELWSAAARLMTVYGKTLPSDRGTRAAITWYRLATIAADRSDDLAVRIWVRGRAALALAYEGAALPFARDLADQAMALSDRPSLGRLNALAARAHLAGFAGDRVTAIRTLDQARQVFDLVGSDEQVSDFAVPEWRFHTFASMLLSRLGDQRAAEEQDAADRTRPPALLRFATHIELHRGLMMAKAGDTATAVDLARSAMAKLPPERQSLSLRLLAAEVERAAEQSPPPADGPVSR